MKASSSDKRWRPGLQHTQVRCQHGLDWYVTDTEGRRVSDPLKTPEAAQRLARQYAARKLEEPAFGVPLVQIEIDPDPRGRWA